MREKLNIKTGCVLILLLLAFWVPLNAAPESTVNKDERCVICGMFVAKYDNWIVQIRLAGGKVLYFDGIKDMLVYYFNPQSYGSAKQEDIQEIWARDYYSLEWIDALGAFYVIGSDVYGPMGKEFIPFSTREAAENFLQDHKGESILTLGEITDDLVQSMRVGAKMLHGER